MDDNPYVVPEESEEMDVRSGARYIKIWITGLKDESSPLKNGEHPNFRAIFKNDEQDICFDDPAGVLP